MTVWPLRQRGLPLGPWGRAQRAPVGLPAPAPPARLPGSGVHARGRDGVHAEKWQRQGLGRLLFPALSALLLVAGSGCAWWTWTRTPAPVPTDTGLVAVLPASYWAAVVLLLLGTTIAVWGPRLILPLAVAHTSALVCVLYGVGVAWSRYPRGTVPWRHVGVAAELATARVVDGSIDAYFSWPGYFALLASYTGLGGVEDGQFLMRWAPVANELLLLAPLLVVLRALTADQRLVWSAVILFYLANWVDQDYLAPQATGYFLYLSALGLLLTVFRPPAPGHGFQRFRALGRIARLVQGSGPEHDATPELRDMDRARVLVLITLVVAAVVVAHQLTPFAFLLAFLVLVTARRVPVRGLPLVAGVLTVGWLTYGAAPYLQGNLGGLLEGLGDVAGAAQGGLVDRIQGSEGHLLVVRARLLFSLAIWGLAGLAVLVHYMRGRRDTAPVLLLASPGLLFGMQSYGGEMLLRIFMFSLPFSCLLAVQLLPRALAPLHRRVAGGLFLAVTLLLAPSFVLVHYGNQLTDQRAEAEVAAVRELYRLAPPEALLVAGNDNTPWRYSEYGQHRHVTLERLLRARDPQDAAAVEEALIDELTRQEHVAYVLLTRQQKEYERLLGRRAPYELAAVEQRLLSSGMFTVLMRNSDAVILALQEQP